MQDPDIQNNRLNFKFIKDNDKNLAEILVFDLYLFPSGDDKERDYFFRVIQLAKELKVEIPSLDELESNLKDAQYRKENIMKYLTLLPRLIAKNNPFIRIIIFSSTEDHEGLENLTKDYGIGVFHKPAVISRMWEIKAVQLIEARNKFIGEIKKAMNFINK